MQTLVSENGVKTATDKRTDKHHEHSFKNDKTRGRIQGRSSSFEKNFTHAILCFYWSGHKTISDIAEEFDITENEAYWFIKKHGLGKKENGIPFRGKRGYVMPDDEKEKHRKQPHAKRIVRICPRTGEVEKRYRSITAAEEDGYNRENVRRAMQTCGLHGNKLWAKEGDEIGVYRIAKKRGLEKKMKALSIRKPDNRVLSLLYKKHGYSARQIAGKYGVTRNTASQWLYKAGISTQKRVDTEKMRKLRESGKSYSEIAGELGCAWETVQRKCKKLGIEKGVR